MNEAIVVKTTKKNKSLESPGNSAVASLGTEDNVRRRSQHVRNLLHSPYCNGIHSFQDTEAVQVCSTQWVGKKMRGWLVRRITREKHLSQKLKEPSHTLGAQMEAEVENRLQEGILWPPHVCLMRASFSEERKCGTYTLAIKLTLFCLLFPLSAPEPGGLRT